MLILAYFGFGETGCGDSGGFLMRMGYVLPKEGYFLR